ncbi:MAG: hypothetical protein GY914_08605, partial [Prochlorococcus sp.]|nr:hypothetical protein [Prochlorococcus sp.]
MAGLAIDSFDYLLSGVWLPSWVCLPSWFGVDGATAHLDACANWYRLCPWWLR